MLDPAPGAYTQVHAGAAPSGTERTTLTPATSNVSSGMGTFYAR